MIKSDFFSFSFFSVFVPDEGLATKYIFLITLEQKDVATKAHKRKHWSLSRLSDTKLLKFSSNADVIRGYLFHITRIVLVVIHLLIVGLCSRKFVGIRKFMNISLLFVFEVFYHLISISLIYTSVSEDFTCVPWSY